jgi:hypothetical protein
VALVGGNTPTITILIGPNQGESEMKTHLLSLLAGTALIATVSVAQAAEPMALSESQMDQVTAGRVVLTAAFANNLRLQTTGVANPVDLRFDGSHSNLRVEFD